MPKACDRCKVPFKGFGTTCKACRKGGLKVQVKQCGVCSNFFSGFGTACADCAQPSICQVCKQAVSITDRIIVDEEHLHLECFKCCVCEARLGIGSFGTWKSKYYCSEHHNEILNDLEAAGDELELMHSGKIGFTSPTGNMGKSHTKSPAKQMVNRWASVLPADPGKVPTAEKFEAPRITHGWQIICGATDDPLPDNLSRGLKGAQASLAHHLGHGGAAVVRVCVHGDDHKLDKIPLAAFQQLTKADEVSMYDRCAEWLAPLKEAVMKEEEGAEEAFESAARQRQLDGQLRINQAFESLKRDVPADFGSVLVVMQFEMEYKGDPGIPPKFGIVGFRYTGEDMFANGRGGRFANIYTRRVGKKLGGFLEKVNFDPFDYDFEQDHVEAFNKLYARAFGFPSHWLSEKRVGEAEGWIHELQVFVDDCQASFDASELMRTADVARANKLVEEYEHGSNMKADFAHSLKKFLDVFDGGGTVEKKKQENLRKWKAHQDLQNAQANFLPTRQLGKNPIPNAGQFSLLDEEFDDLLPTFFEDQLSRGRWLCFRMEDPHLIQCEYSVVTIAESDNGTYEGGSFLGEEFKAWNSSFDRHTQDNKPLKFINAPSVPEATFDEMKDMYNLTTTTKFEKAIGKLQEVGEAQSLCVYRFRAQLEDIQDACLNGPPLCDLPTTWESAQPESRITVAMKSKRMLGWLASKNVLKSEFLINESPEKYGTPFGITYKEAVKKARGS